MPRRASKETLFKNTMRGLSYPTPANPSHSHSPAPSHTFSNRLLKKSLSIFSPSKPNPPAAPMTAASPSASILLISASNRILLLHRVGNSSAFASAHVFPGGHVDAQDGALPAEGERGRHEDGAAYRMAGVRECFEESGILLARPDQAEGGGGDKALLRLTEEEREQGRKDVHDGTIAFDDWVRDHGGVLDIEGLIPFTRWLTPANLAKRYSTQMYLYFLPLAPAPAAVAEGGGEDGDGDGELHIPTPDGGVEHTAASFKHASEWLDMAIRREIVLFPPQFFLLSLVAGFLQPLSSASMGERHGLLRTQRQRLREWVERDGEPPWREKCISPNPIKREKGKWLIMGMSEPGPEVEGLGRKGDMERVLRVELDKETERGRERPRPVEVCWRRDLLGDEGRGKGAKM